MRDLTSKAHGGGVRLKKKKAQLHRKQKHDAINLPKNLVLSDSEGYEEQLSSDEENDQLSQRAMFYKGSSELSSKFMNMVLSERQGVVEEAYHKLLALINKYKLALETSTFKDKELISRGGVRNKSEEHKKNKPYDVSNRRGTLNQDLSVTTPHRNGGRILVDNLKAVTVSNLSAPPEEHLLDLIEAVEDMQFISTFKSLSDDEFHQVFYKIMSEEQDDKQVPPSPPTRLTGIVSPTQKLLTPVTSPGSLDLYDSSYETGSPCSTIVTSPGSLSTHFSPPRSSISSESDQEPDFAVEPCTNIAPAASAVRFAPKPEPNIKSIAAKCEPTMRPLGEAVSISRTSATDTLEKLHNSSSFCINSFSIQLVRVVMSAKGQGASDQVEGFCKSLLSTMKMKLGNKPHEEDIWQMSILAHIQFLLARAEVYRPALQRRDERGHSVLYIAAVEQYQRPVIARYIAESMIKVGCNPLNQVDENGNTILHTVAMLGDSHVQVLGELMMACGSGSVAAVNRASQTSLHVAVQSPNTHLTTVLVLLKFGANPFQLDANNMTALHYHIQHMARRVSWSTEDVEVIRKMLQAPVSLKKDSLHCLELLHTDPSVPVDLKRIIVHEFRRYCVKDFRPKKIERISLTGTSSSHLKQDNLQPCTSGSI